MGARLTVFLGASHLGLVSGVGWASLGHRVVVLDLDAALITRLQRRDLPVYEPGLAELLERQGGDVAFTTDFRRLAEADLVVVARDVPTDAVNDSDLSSVAALIDGALPHLADGVAVAVMSQVSPGFTRALDARIRSERPGLDVRTYTWVETLILGQAVARFLEPECIILGCAEPAAPLARALEDGLRKFGCAVLPMRWESAELTKRAINLYLATTVTYANTLADLCEALGADWGEMVPALRLDRRIGPGAYLRPSLGIAGGNIERDLVSLGGMARAAGRDGAFIESISAYNGRRFTWLLRQVDRALAGVAAPTIAVWGLTYKKDTRSTKNSMGLRAVEALAPRASVRAWDPVLGAADVDMAATLAPSGEAALARADCLLITADWDEFAAVDATAFRAMRRPLVIDCVGVLEARRHELDGVEYVSMGRAPMAGKGRAAG
jgi:UDPglucose 6-dehydrogenase